MIKLSRAQFLFVSIPHFKPKCLLHEGAMLRYKTIYISLLNSLSFWERWFTTPFIEHNIIPSHYVILPRQNAAYCQCFLALVLSYSIYFVQPTSSTPQVKLVWLTKCFSMFFVHSLITTYFLKYLIIYFLHIQVYIVYLGLNHIGDPSLTLHYHIQLLSTVFTWSLFNIFFIVLLLLNAFFAGTS